AQRVEDYSHWVERLPRTSRDFHLGTRASGARIRNRLDSQLGVAAGCQRFTQLLRGICTLTARLVDRRLGNREVDDLASYDLAPLECVHCGTSTVTRFSAC